MYMISAYNHLEYNLSKYMFTYIYKINICLEKNRKKRMTKRAGEMGSTGTKLLPKLTLGDMGSLVCLGNRDVWRT